MPLDLVTTHQNADLDGMASMVALHLWHGPLVLVQPAGMDPDTHTFWEEHAAALPPLAAQRQLRQRLLDGPLGRLFVADTANPSRLGEIAKYIDKFAQIVAYDTHPPAADDLPRGRVDATGGACVSGLVLQLAKVGITPTAAEAGLFLLGIHQDTGHFTFASTTPVDHQAAAQCGAWGAPPAWPSRYVPKGFTRTQLALLEELARRVEIVDLGTHRVAVTALELRDYEPNISVLLEQLREAERWPAAVAVVSVGDRAFCIARSRGALDMGELMRGLGGGGHVEAASTVLRGVTLAEALKAVDQSLRQLIGQQMTAGAMASRPVLSLPAIATIGEAADSLHRLRVNALPLVRGRGRARRYVGLVSRQDVDAAVRHGLSLRPVTDISGQAPAWVPVDAPLWEIRQALVAGTSRLLLVGTPPAAAGVLTRGLVLRAMAPAPTSQSHRPPPAAVVLALLRKHFGDTWELMVRLAALAQQLALPIYLVGGSVRDMFLGVPGRDLDLVVEGDAPALVRAAARQVGGDVVLPQGFATARWHPPGHPPLDFASSRSEFYAAPAALPAIEHASLNQDLFRRDFTVNAMAVALCGPQPGRVYDPFGGFSDLRAGALRVLHGLSFQDDPTRAWRAARFAARFDFQLAPDTQGLLKAAVSAGVMDRLSPERLGAELELLLAERDVAQGFRLVRQWGMAPRIHPKFRADRGLLDRLRAAQRARHLLQGILGAVPAQPDVLWTVLAAAIPAADRAARSRYISGGKKRRARWLTGPERLTAALAAFDSPVVARWNQALDTLDAAERVCAFAATPRAKVREHIVWWEQHGRHIRSVVDGHALRQLGYPTGPAFKDALARALDAARSGADAGAQLQAALQAL